MRDRSLDDWIQPQTCSYVGRGSCVRAHNTLSSNFNTLSLSKIYGLWVFLGSRGSKFGPWHPHLQMSGSPPFVISKSFRITPMCTSCPNTLTHPVVGSLPAKPYCVGGILPYCFKYCINRSYATATFPSFWHVPLQHLCPLWKLSWNPPITKHSSLRTPGTITTSELLKHCSQSSRQEKSSHPPLYVFSVHFRQTTKMCRVQRMVQNSSPGRYSILMGFTGFLLTSKHHMHLSTNYYKTEGLGLESNDAINHNDLSKAKQNLKPQTKSTLL